MTLRSSESNSRKINSVLNTVNEMYKVTEAAFAKRVLQLDHIFPLRGGKRHVRTCGWIAVHGTL